MRTIFESNEVDLIARCIREIGARIDITKYKRRVSWVQLTIAEGPRTPDVIARVEPNVTVEQLREVLA